MSAPACCACCVRSRQSLADIAAVQAWTTTSGFGPAALLDCDLQQRFRSSIVSDQNSAMPLVHHSIGCLQFADAVAHQRPVRVPVDVVAVLAAERRVEAVADSAQRGTCPVARVACCCHAASSGEVAAAVDVDVGAGHVGVAPGGQKCDDGPDLVGQTGARQMRGVPEVLVDGRPSTRRGRRRRRRPSRAQPASASDAMLPGETTLTMISSLASARDRFFEMLVTIALAPCRRAGSRSAAASSGRRS